MTQNAAADLSIKSQHATDDAESMRQKLTQINSIWKGAILVCLFAAVVLVLVIVQYSQSKFQSEVEYSSDLAIQTARPTAEMAVEFLDSNMAGIVTDGLINSSYFNRVQIIDDFGKLLEESSKNIPIDGFYGWLATMLQIDLVHTETIPLALSNGNHGEFILEINSFPIFSQIARESLVFIFFALILPFIFGIVLYLAGPYRLKRSLVHLHDWVDRSDVHHQLPLPAQDKLYFTEIHQLGARFADITQSLSDQLIENDIQRAEMMHLSVTDPLTGCKNRRYLDRLTSLDEDKDTTQNIAAMVFFDIDDFKYINGRFGHSVGDKILKMFGKTLLSSFKKIEHPDLRTEAIRFGGDEFLIILIGKPHAENLGIKVRKICEEIQNTIGQATSPELQGHTIKATTGYFIESRNNVSLRYIVDDVTTAMGLLKGMNKGEIVNLSSERRYSVSRRQTIRKDFSDGLSNGSIFLNYQPIISTKDNAISGYEALIRWKHPKLGSIKPFEFVHYLETGPLSATATQLMIDMMFDDIHDIGLDLSENSHQYLSFNLSGHQIVATDVVGILKDNLAKHNIRPQQIQIEITEAIEIIIIDSVKQQLQDIHDMGIGIALDDFGTGYSAIKLLIQLPITKLKLDRTILQSDFSKAHRYSLLNNLNAMCHDLGVSTVCEGVEDEEQLALTMQVGCDELQGFYFSPAVEVAALRDGELSFDIEHPIPPQLSSKHQTHLTLQPREAIAVT